SRLGRAWGRVRDRVAARRWRRGRRLAPGRHARQQAERVRRLPRRRREADRRRLDYPGAARDFRRLQWRAAGRRGDHSAARSLRRGSVLRPAAGHDPVRAVRARRDLERRVRHRRRPGGVRLAALLLPLSPRARRDQLPRGAVHDLRRRHQGGPDARAQDVRRAAARHLFAVAGPADTAAPGVRRWARGTRGQPLGVVVGRHPRVPRLPHRPQPVSMASRYSRTAGSPAWRAATRRPSSRAPRSTISGRFSRSSPSIAFWLSLRACSGWPTSSRHRAWPRTMSERSRNSPGWYLRSARSLAGRSSRASWARSSISIAPLWSTGIDATPQPDHYLLLIVT